MKRTNAWLSALLALAAATGAQAAEVAAKPARPLQARLSRFGAHPATSSQASPEALRTRLVAEVQRWQPVIRQTAIYAD